MHRLRNSLLYPLLLCATLLSALEAQTGQGRFRTLGWDVQLQDIYYMLSGKDVPIVVYSGTRSPFYDLPSGESLTLYRIERTAEDEIVRVPVVEASMERGGTWPLMIITPDDSTSETDYRATVIPDDLTAFPAPHLRFINLSPVPLNVNVGSNRSTVDSRDMISVDPQLDPNSTRTETRFITITVDAADGPLRIYSNNWAVGKSQRTIVLLRGRKGALGVQRVIDDRNQYLSLLRLNE